MHRHLRPDGPVVPAWVKRVTPPDSETPTRSKMAVDRLTARREVHLREKTLRRMLYGTCARAEEIVGANIEEPPHTPSTGRVPGPCGHDVPFLRRTARRVDRRGSSTGCTSRCRSTPLRALMTAISRSTAASPTRSGRRLSVVTGGVVAA